MLALITPLIIVLTSGFLLIDSIGSSQTTYSFIGISSSKILLFTLLALFLLRWKKNNFFQKKKYYLLIGVGFILTSIITVMLSIWAFFTPPNYVYSITRIQPEQLGELSLFLGSVFFLFKTKSWWKHNSKRVLLFTPFISLFIFLIIRIWPQDYFLIITGEDQLVEYLQFFVLLFGSGILCYQLIRYYSQLNKFVLFSMLVLAFSFIFLAGEEISWGQRILNLTSSEYMVKNNLQGEITLHNLDYIQWTVEIAYVVIGILGGTLWLIKKTKIHLPPYINWLIPSSYLFAFFIIPGIYYAYPVYSGKNLIREWAEVMELFLYAGIVLHAITMNNLIIPKLTKHPQIKK